MTSYYTISPAKFAALPELYFRAQWVSQLTRSQPVPGRTDSAGEPIAHHVEPVVLVECQRGSPAEQALQRAGATHHADRAALSAWLNQDNNA